ncbi:MAG: hypothetical protein KatS3mg051_1044 [Anaerolineae bacterium]|nr:MAG: hypothetical protein KatS3mg051_1044 [Anaerolineae bacterium]
MSNVAKAALWYAKIRGWYVVPLHTPLFDEDGTCVGCTCEAWRRRTTPDYTCSTPGKHPRLRDWEANASNDPAVVASWWRRWPNANVGIAAGRSGLLMLDIDSYKDVYAGAELLSPEDEETLTSLSGGGGSHLIYAMPEGASYGNATGTLPPGIDVRGYGGQFVAPPSIHPSGRPYQWELGYGPHERDPLPVPERLRQLLDECNDAPVSVAFSDAQMEAPDLSIWRLSPRILSLIHDPPGRGERSEADQAVIAALVLRGASDDEIRAVFEHYPIGKEGKFHDKGPHAVHYLAHSIQRAREWARVRQRELAERRTDEFFRKARIA